MIIDAEKLKSREDTPNIGGWYYKQIGGKDPRIIFIYQDYGAIRRLNIIVRKNSIYISHSSTVSMDIFDKMVDLIKQSQELLK